MTTFTHNQKEYEIYDADGFRPLGIMDGEGNDINDLDVYAAAEQALVEDMYDRADMLRDRVRERI